jgi:hypothetical protein
MSLAMFAAPFDDNVEGLTSNSDNNNIMNKKRRAHTRTQKMHTKENFDNSQNHPRGYKILCYWAALA